MSIFQIIIAGWRFIFRVLQSLCKYVYIFFCGLLNRIGFCKKKCPETKKEYCCITPPEKIRARPDPYIYSQQWLEIRHVAYVWDNPDFSIIDPDANTSVNSHELKPNKNYIVQATIHNNSTMAAIGTTVKFQVLQFGAGSTVLADLGTVIVDVPAAGSAYAKINWLTPATAGHNCLKAIIYHPDDANPLNNVGQHNTDVAVPASPTRKISFHVGRKGYVIEKLRFEMDSYQLPKEPMRAKTFEERNSSKYLKKLQAENDRKRFPVPEYLSPRIHGMDSVEIARGEIKQFTLELNPPPRGRGRHSINVNAFDGDKLVGGLTIYVEEGGI